NDVTEGLGLGLSGRFGIGRQGRGLRDIRRRAAATQAGKNPDLLEAQFDDDAIMALYLSAGQSRLRAARELTRLHQDANGNWEGHRDANGNWVQDWNEERVKRAVATAQGLGI